MLSLWGIVTRPAWKPDDGERGTSSALSAVCRDGPRQTFASAGRPRDIFARLLLTIARMPEAFFIGLAAGAEKDAMNVERRDLALDPTACRDDSRTVSASLSSTYPVERSYGKEILLHNPSAVDLSREPLPLLVSHGSDQLPVGTVDNLTLSGDKLRGVIRFGASARALEIWNDVKAGILRSLSIGYQILHGEQRGDTYLVDRWQPLEVSFVSIPADPSVGVGRSFNYSRKEKTPMETQQSEQWSAAEKAERKQLAERGVRTLELLAIGEKFQCEALAKKAIREDWSVDELKDRVIAERGKARPIVDSPSIGLTAKEADSFSICRAALALSQGRRDLAPFELEVSNAVASRMGKQPQGLFIPMDVMQRGLSKGSNAGGGYTVETSVLAGSIIELLRNSSMVRRLGARILGGLVGDVAIPKVTTGAGAYWVAEGIAPTASTQAFAQVAMTPKTVGTYTDISRKLLLQSSIDVESFVRADFAAKLAVEQDRVVLAGSSTSGEPTGILNTTGIGAVVGGDNGLAPTWDHIVKLEGEVAIDNAAIGNLGYLTNAAVISKLKRTLKNSASGSDYVIGDARAVDGLMTMNGHPLAMSNNVPGALSKGTSNGTCSAIVFGNWADILIGEWGALDMLVDPYSLSTTGSVRIRVLMDLDVAIRHAESFAAMVDALTA